jgi:hypothetical protein
MRSSLDSRILPKPAITETDILPAVSATFNPRIVLYLESIADVKIRASRRQVTAANPHCPQVGRFEAGRKAPPYGCNGRCGWVFKRPSRNPGF